MSDTIVSPEVGKVQRWAEELKNMKITIDVLSAIEDNQLRMLCQCTSGFMELTKAVLKLDGVTFFSLEEFLAQHPLQELKSAYNSIKSKT